MRHSLLSLLLVTLSWTFATSQAQYKVLWSFTGEPNDGSGPVSSLTLDRKGNLYGTTEYGGNSSNPWGTVFELSPDGDGGWAETVLYKFCSDFSSDGFCLDGAYPMAGLVFDSMGNLYGTTKGGGSFSCSNGLGGCGTVFELSPSGSGKWTESILYNFCADSSNGACLDGAEPVSQLTIDTAGNLYGTTSTGGTGGTRNDCCWGGTVFELSPGAGSWTHIVLYNFCANGSNDICPDGAGPQAGVVFDNAGDLYGTTQGGGSTRNLGHGTFYLLSPGSNGWTEKVLLGGVPIQNGGTPLGGVTLDSRGYGYSTFSSGGAASDGGVFRYGFMNGKSITFSFNGSNGQTPSAGVLLDGVHAALYGTTFVGGANACGTVFSLEAPLQESVLYSFGSQPSFADGCGPLASVIEDKSGNLYGTTKIGGTSTNCQFGCGVVFEVTR